MKKRYNIIIPIVLIIVLALLFMDRIVDFIVNIKWFKELGYLSVYFTQIVATMKLMVPIFLICFIGIMLYYNSLKKSFIKHQKIVEVHAKTKKREKIIFFYLNTIISFIIS